MSSFVIHNALNFFSTPDLCDVNIFLLYMKMTFL